MKSATVLTIVLAVWFLLVLVGGALGVFQSAPSSPPLPILVAIAGPLLLFALVYRASPPFRHFVLGIDLRLLTAIQSWRVIGGMFLALYAFDLLPGLFAWPAGVGDLAVGLAAPNAISLIPGTRSAMLQACEELKRRLQ